MGDILGNGQNRPGESRIGRQGRVSVNDFGVGELRFRRVRRGRRGWRSLDIRKGYDEGRSGIGVKEVDETDILKQ